MKSEKNYDIFAHTPFKKMETGDGIIDFTEKLPGKVNSAEQERNNRIINSSVAYMASVAIVFVSFYLVTAFFAKRNNLFYKLYFFKVEFQSCFLRRGYQRTNHAQPDVHDQL
jgi:hypothetical protein